MYKAAKKPAIVIGLLLLCVSIAFIGTNYHELRQPGVIALKYHRIITGATSSNKYDLTIDKFNAQLDLLKKKGYSTILPRELSEQGDVQQGKKIIILTFDDGTADHFSMVYSLLKQKGFKGVFFVVSNMVNSRGYMTEKQISEMATNGMEIGSHSVSHPFLDTIDFNNIYYELNQSKRDLETIKGVKVSSFAPPGGWYNESVVQVAREAGYNAFFGANIGTNDLNKKPFVYNRIEVLGNMSLVEFNKLLDPPQILTYKLLRSFKFMIHGMIGSKNYEKLSNTFSG
jgi:peptidoglycan/xylan/chitin deacetylase (PgdA/CDA1 family)